MLMSEVLCELSLPSCIYHLFHDLCSYAPDDRDELSPHQEETKPKILLMGLRR